MADYNLRIYEPTRRRQPAPPIEPETSKLLIHEEPLQVLPSLAVVLGLNEAIFIQQVHYRIGHKRREGDTRTFRDGHYWVFNSYPEWQKEFPFWSESTLYRLIRAMEQPFQPKGGDSRPPRNPVLIAAFGMNQMGIDRTKWYRPDYEELDRLATLACPSLQPDEMVSATCGDGLVNLTRSSRQSDETNNQRRPTETSCRDAEAAPAPALPGDDFNRAQAFFRSNATAWGRIVSLTQQTELINLLEGYFADGLDLTPATLEYVAQDCAAFTKRPRGPYPFRVVEQALSKWAQESQRPQGDTGGQAPQGESVADREERLYLEDLMKNRDSWARRGYDVNALIAAAQASIARSARVKDAPASTPTYPHGSV